MDHLTLKGSYYEMGLKYGKVLRSAGFRLPFISDKTRNFSEQCRDYISSIFPEYLEELHGIADATQLDYDLICAFALVVQEAPNCSIFAVSQNDHTYIGRNYDMYYNFEENLESTLCIPNNGYKSVAQSDIFVGREDGINEKGLGVAQSGIISYLKPGLAFWVNVRYLLDKCSSVQQGVDFLTNIPHYSTMTYLLADKKGTMTVVEIGPEDTCAIRESIDHYLVSTNHYNHPRMKDVDIYVPPDSYVRYDTICRALGTQKGRISEKTIKDILSSHEGLVCSHRDEIQLGTLWSVVYNLSDLRICRSEGHPCVSSYVEDTRLIDAIKT
ncbi:MAG: hypothetical protein EU530_06980 [Promethearchaeota archaeon]|nr:MAG: hypothetical protein EU530_06980 [Candidatus Lokiarchaeota archaeon]